MSSNELLRGSIILSLGLLLPSCSTPAASASAQLPSTPDSVSRSGMRTAIQSASVYEATFNGNNPVGTSNGCAYTGASGMTFRVAFTPGSHGYQVIGEYQLFGNRSFVAVATSSAYGVFWSLQGNSTPRGAKGTYTQVNNQGTLLDWGTYKLKQVTSCTPPASRS